MSEPARVLTVLRGDALKRPPAAAPWSTPAPGAAPAPAPGSAETVYGVPASAVQHCCGRGCRHCRIYWHKSTVK